MLNLSSRIFGNFLNSSSAAIRHNSHRFISIMNQESSLAFMDVKNPTNPAALFKECLEEAKQCGAPATYMNLATASLKGKVSNRTVVIREIMPDGLSLAFVAQGKSNKIKDIIENPQVAATILMIYDKDGIGTTRQVRFQGIAEKLSQEQCKLYYEKGNLHTKIRSWIGRDCGTVDWNDLKKQHDQLLKDVVENNKILEMPDTQVAYKIVPNEIDFYYSQVGQIADRLLFKKLENSSEWTYERLKA